MQISNSTIHALITHCEDSIINLKGRIGALEHYIEVVKPDEKTTQYLIDQIHSHIKSIKNTEKIIDMLREDLGEERYLDAKLYE